MNDLSPALSVSLPGRLNSKTPHNMTGARIVADQDIPAFQLLNGAAASPVIVSVPHGGWLYPASLVHTDNLEKCKSLADTGTAELGYRLAETGYPVLRAVCGRAACDLNRPASALDPLLCEQTDNVLTAQYKPYVSAGYGVIPRLSARKQPLYSHKLARSRWQAMLSAWHSPFHHQLDRLVRIAARQHDKVILVDLHSMPDSPKQSGRTQSMLKRGGHLPDFVFGNLYGTTTQQTTTQTVDEVIRQNGYSWRWNSPYAGGYITRHYGLSADDTGQKLVQVLQVEVNRGLYTTPSGQLIPDRLAPISQTLRQLLDALITA